MSQIIIHCGLHKTASTMIQNALALHADALRSTGFLFPSQGRIEPISGHHNLAWQISRDRRFDSDSGTIDSLFDEIHAFPGTVIVSSEDFENSLGHPDRFLPFLERARASGKTVAFLIYLRKQTSYLESLYQEMVKHGFGEEFIDYADAALAHGKLRLKEWEFQFNYWNALNNLRRLRECKLVVRSYEAIRDGSPISDFFEAVGIPQSAVPADLNARVNVRYPAKVSLMQFFSNRIGRALEDCEKAAIEALFGLFTEPISITGVLRHRLEQMFAYSNKQVCNHFGISPYGLVRDDTAPAPANSCISLQNMFSFQTQITIRELSRLIALGQTEAADTLARQCVDGWRCQDN